MLFMKSRLAVLVASGVLLSGCQTTSGQDSIVELRDAYTQCIVEQFGIELLKDTDEVDPETLIAACNNQEMAFVVYIQDRGAKQADTEKLSAELRKIAFTTLLQTMDEADKTDN